MPAGRRTGHRGADGPGFIANTTIDVTPPTTRSQDEGHPLSRRGCGAQLDELAERLPVDERPLNSADASDRIARHVSRQVERALLDVSDGDRVQVGVRVARALLDRLGELVATDRTGLPVEPAAVLQAVRRRNPDGTPAQMGVPLIPLLDTTLLTHASGEPTLWSQLQSEIESADAIDVVVAFIRRSGIRPLLESLRRHCEAGRALRMLTTTYTDSTERSAIDQHVDLGADVRISYDTSTTRLHANAWVFHRGSGFSTAYVGSSSSCRPLTTPRASSSPASLSA